MLGLMNEPEQNPAPLTGRCICGKVSFTVSEPLVGMALCYCKRCQRRTGTAFSATALTQPGSFSVTDGEDLVKTYVPGGDGWLKSFCSECGSQLYTTNPENPELIAVRAGAVDGDPGVRPGLHQFTDYAAEWWPVPDDELPHFSERMKWD